MTDTETRFSLIEMDTPTAPDHRFPRPSPAVAPVRAAGSVPPGVPAIPAPTAPARSESSLQPVTASAPAVVQAVAGAVQQARREIPLSSGARAAVGMGRPVPAPQPLPELRAGNVVAGAAASGHGVLVGWSGSGSLSRKVIGEILTAAAAPIEWMPRSKSAHAYAGQAAKSLDGRGFVSRAERMTKGAAADRSVRARWTVGAVGHTVAGGGIGAAFGERVLSIALIGDELQIEGAPELAAIVRQRFTEARDAESYQAGEVTAWLREILVGKLRAVRLGGVWYVPARFAAAAETLCREFSRRWGADWMVPALPVATSDQLLDGLANGLQAEIAAIEDEIASARTEAAPKEIGARAAAGFVLQLQTLASRIENYAALLGAAKVAAVKNRAQRAASSLDGIADDTSLRFALIADERENGPGSKPWAAGL